MEDLCDTEPSLYDAIDELHFACHGLSCEKNTSPARYSSLSTPLASPTEAESVDLCKHFSSVIESEQNRDSLGPGRGPSGNAKSLLESFQVSFSQHGSFSNRNPPGSKTDEGGRSDNDTVETVDWLLKSHLNSPKETRTIWETCSLTSSEQNVNSSSGVLSFGEELDAYIKEHVMPYCSHEDHPSAVTILNTESTLDIGMDTLEEDFTVSEMTAELESMDCCGFDTSKNGPEDMLSSLQEQCSGDLVTNDKGVSMRIEQDKHLPIVLVERLSDDVILAAIRRTPVSTVGRWNKTSSSTGSRTSTISKKRKTRSSVENTPEVELLCSTSLNSTPLSTASISKKRGRGRKKSDGASSAHPVTHLDGSEDGVINAVSVRSRVSRRASTGAIYVDALTADEQDNLQVGADVTRSMCGRYSLRQRKKSLCDTS